jgi:arylsulfatase A
VHDPPLVFNLADDPGERFNIAGSHPSVVADLTAIADRHRRSVIIGKPLFDALLPPAAPAR